jgi:Na+-transporting methylmalonyl-CoA/oxaloacetate decarboxylase gamma subunit
MPLAAAVAFPWLNLVWVILGIVALLFTVAGVGRWLAATHPEPAERTRPTAGVPEATQVDSGVSPEIEAAIAAAVHVTLGASATVTSVVLQRTQPVSVENLMLTWSLEGRRQIYTSHKVR